MICKSCEVFFHLILSINTFTLCRIKGFETGIISFVSTVLAQVYIQFLYLDREVTFNVKETKAVGVRIDQLSFYRLPLIIDTTFILVQLSYKGVESMPNK